MWHTADWPADFDFKGKSVAYIGTGPTAIQVLPILQPQVKTLKVFYRSLTYLHPFSNIEYPTTVRWAFRWVPGLPSLYSLLVGFLFGVWSYFVFRPGSYLSKLAERTCLNFLEHEVHDPELRQKLAPTGRFGSKRPLVSKDFYKVLQKENVEIIDRPITRINPTGLVTGRSAVSDNQVPAVLDEMLTEVDVIIWGTGFKMQGWGGAFPTTGLDDTLLSTQGTVSSNITWYVGPLHILF